MSEAAAEFHPGDQDISGQLATYALFGRMMKWVALGIAVLLVMLVLWFCVDAGFFTGLFAGVVLLALGITFLRARPAETH
jgi:predicted membrane channel-forming protein YqfA (hemolysin III family)